jgi:hypothetical protein
MIRHRLDGRRIIAPGFVSDLQARLLNLESYDRADQPHYFSPFRQSTAKRITGPAPEKFIKFIKFSNFTTFDHMYRHPDSDHKSVDHLEDPLPLSRPEYPVGSD